MTVLTQDLARTAGYIVSEANGYRSREQVVIASGSGVLKPGAVLGKITISGEFGPFDPTEDDGREVAAAVLYEGCDATIANVRRAVTARDSEVQIDALIWGAGVTTNQKTAALASLASLGIIGR